ncbi:hypothetical protein [uncultured Gammaproteobacteria bacterium]|jgi:hypothetical protein|nr:hypothetical protein [uncultured Gammaproteobacteria bacterium]
MNSIKTVKGLLSQDFTIKAFDCIANNNKVLLYQIGLDDEAKALIDLEGKYKNNEIESLTSGQTKLEKHNIHTTIKFVDYLKDNNYSVTEDSKL